MPLSRMQAGAGSRLGQLARPVEPGAPQPFVEAERLRSFPACRSASRQAGEGRVGLTRDRSILPAWRRPARPRLAAAPPDRSGGSAGDARPRASPAPPAPRGSSSLPQPSSDTSFGVSASAVAPSVSAFSSTSSSRSSMSRRMARPANARNPAAARKPSGASASLTNEVSPARGSAGTLLQLRATCPTAAPAAPPRRAAAASADRRSAVRTTRRYGLSARITRAAFAGDAASRKIERAEILAQLMGDAARLAGQRACACRLWPRRAMRNASSGSSLAAMRAPSHSSSRRCTLSRGLALQAFIGQQRDRGRQRRGARPPAAPRWRRPTTAAHVR